MRKINSVVMTLAGLLLIAAAALKAHQVLTVYFPSWRQEGIWESWEFFLAQIPLEFALGIWLVSGLFRKAAWVAGTGAYILFVGVTLYKALSGQESCGCFGRVEMDPWITLFAIDVPLALLLLFFRPKGLKLLPPPWPHVGHAIAAAIPIFAALMLTAPLLVAFRPEFIQPEDWTPANPILRPVLTPEPVPVEPTPVVEPVIDPNSAPVVEPKSEPAPIPQPVPEPEPRPEPQAQQSQPTQTVQPPPLWPWLEHVDIAEQLKEGIVIVYMYHYDCPRCAESLPKYEAYSKKMAESGEEGFEIAYIAVPPYGKGLIPEDTVCLKGKLTDKKKWFITSPFVVALIDGAVVRQWEQGTAPEPDKILDEIFGQ